MSSDTENEGKHGEQEKPSSPHKNVMLPFAGQKELRHEDLPPQAPVDKRIHRRRPLPPVPEAQPSKDNSPQDRSGAGDAE